MLFAGLRRALPYGYQGALIATALIALPPAGAIHESEVTSRLLALGLGLAWVFFRLELRSWRERRSALDPQPPSAATPPPIPPRAKPAKPALARTMIGTGPRAPAPQPMPAVIDTTAEPQPQSAALARSTRPGHAGAGWLATSSDMLAQYESPSAWSPDPALSEPRTRTELRALCDQLYLLAAEGCRVIRVSSDLPSAGVKSHIAAQIARSLADFGHARVLLLEADFDDPGVHRVMRLDTPAFKGFSQQLHRRRATGERLPWTVARCGPCLSVLPEGRIRTPGLLHTAEFSSALAELRRYYGLIVVDGPPVETSTDTRALDGVADGVVFAVTAGAGSADGMKLASERFGDKSLLWIVPTHPHASEAHG